MEFLDLIRQRYSVRSYRPNPVEEEKLQAVLEAGRLAPTAANKQPFKIYVIPTEKHEEALRKVCPPEWFVQAPLVLAVVGLRERCWVRRDGRCYLDVDAAIVMDHMILSAHNQGLGTCWIAAFNEAEARTLLGLPEGEIPILLAPLGYPADEPGPKLRKPLADLVIDLRA